MGRRRIGISSLALFLATGIIWGQTTKPRPKAATPKPASSKSSPAKPIPVAAPPAAVPIPPPTAEELARAAALEAVVETDAGVFRFGLAPDKAPRHAVHFLRNVEKGIFDGNAFFRAVPGGIIQGGDPLVNDASQPTTLWGSGGLRLLPDEFSDYKHEAGTVSAVRIPGQANSGGTQFFVCAGPQPPLDGQYSAFGRVTEGLEVVDRISRGTTDERQMLAEPIRILKVTLQPKRVEPFVSATVAEMQKVVRIETSQGTFRARMRPDWAPETVRNFLKLAATGWYDRTAFHRLAKGFVIQGGMGDTRENAEGHFAQRWVHTIKGEFRDDIKHQRGTLSMARGDDPDSGMTSFFVVLGQASHLDGKYAAFGEVIEGQEVLDKIEALAVNGEDPVSRLGLVKATVE